MGFSAGHVRFRVKRAGFGAGNTGLAAGNAGIFFTGNARFLQEMQEFFAGNAGYFFAGNAGIFAGSVGLAAGNFFSGNTGIFFFSGNARFFLQEMQDFFWQKRRILLHEMQDFVAGNAGISEQPSRPPAPFLLHVEERDAVAVPQQEAPGARVENLVAVGNRNLLGDLIL